MNFFKTLTLISLVGLGACKKQTAPRATLTIVDVNEKVISGASVNINGRAAIGNVVDTTIIADLNGQIFYTRKFEAVLEATAKAGTRTGTEYFQLKNNETTEKTIIIK